MRWTADGVHVGTVFGIPLLIQNSVFAAAALVAFMAIGASSTRDLAINLFVLPLLIASIVAHELAHAHAAARFGMPVRHIALTWFGGFAEFWLTPNNRWREAAIAFAGPAINLVIAASSLTIVAAAFPPPPYIEKTDGENHWLWLNPQYREPALQVVLSRVGWFNLALGLFNLLPGLPLDGGHIARAILARFISRGRAGIACWSGVIIGAGVVVSAFITESVWLLLIGAVVTVSAWLEKRRLRYD